MQFCNNYLYFLLLIFLQITNYLEILINMSSINMNVLVRYYIISNLFIKRNRKFAKYLLIYNYKNIYILFFFIYLSFFSKYFCNCLDTKNNIKFVIQIKIYFVKINNKTKINIFEKTIFYRLINQFSKTSSILKNNNKDIQLDITSYLAY